jgi:UDP-glucose 4-epimerase
VKGWYNFISYWIQLAVSGEPLPIYGDGMQIRDYTYVDDVSDAFVLALNNSRAVGETFLLASGERISLLELARKVIDLTKSGSQLKSLPARKGDVRRFVGNSKKAREMLGWRCKVPLDAGLKAEVDWVRTTCSR